MKDFTGLELCNEHGLTAEVHVRASLTDGALTFAGHDLGSYVEDFWGDSDYEYWIELDKENTGKLFALIHGEKDPEAALRREFSGLEGCSRLREMCTENGIKYSFFSYV